MPLPADTNNNVYEEGSERYAHISLARDLTPPDFEVMLFLRNELKLNLNDSGDSTQHQPHARVRIVASFYNILLFILFVACLRSR